jgi:raffinose/stachyose/melibiose transport system substrate-binding protein
MKKRLLSAFLCAAMVFSMTACGSSSDSSSDATDSTAAAETSDSDSEWEYKEATLTFLIDSDTASAGYQAVFDLMEEKTGIHVETELRVSGGDGDNVVKTRLASGDMADLCGYNSGSKLGELNPEENFIDLSGYDFADRLDDTYKSAVSGGSDTAVYGVPLCSTYLGAVLYNKDLYEEYGLEVPNTWDEFLANCDVLKEAGVDAVIGSLGDSWTIQVPYLGDHYNVQAADPDFAEKFEAGEAKYATTDAGLESFQKLADLTPYFNADYTATTYADACDKLVNGEGAHWFILSQALSTIYESYGDDVNKIGVFGIPGDDASNHGITVWEPTSIYGNANSDKQDDIIRFMEFYTSDEALDAFTEAQKPDGPYCIKGYELPEDSYDAVKEAQEYFDAGLTCTALEFQTSVKGTNCEYICSEVATGQTTAAEAAAAYDEDCKKQATQLGLDWD